MKLSLVSNRYPNNNNTNNTNITTTKGENVTVNFKKLTEKGKEKMRAPYNSKEHYTGQAIRVRIVELDFKEEFIEKMLKEYSVKKIEEKLDLLIERKNIQSPAGWLRSALKNNYRGEEQESRPHLQPPLPSPPEVEGQPRVVEEITAQGKGEEEKILSNEEARRRFHFLRQKLMAMK